MLISQAVSKLSIALVVQLLGINSVGVLFYMFYAVPIFSLGFLAKVFPKEIHILPMKRDDELEKKLWRIMRHSVILVATIGIIDYLDILFVQKLLPLLKQGFMGGWLN